ncbi:hypothetical protein ACU19_02125 [Actinobaculum suis]|uniref:polyphenol oxidase family protein n=1 Tax=Actinobaculum suis TaxID=1657 RepID=UPI00066FBB97|nr:polyphenol oxidase family protein [Actinobaculum suis]KMY23815.1 hypothetical protein ACU19_02125 [Actinobaculum suis]
MLVRWVCEREISGYVVKAGFTSRAGGVSESPFESCNLGHHVGDNPGRVSRNRELLARELGTRPVFMDQVHGTRIADAAALAESGCYASPETDGLTLAPPAAANDGKASFAAAVMVADCMPVLLVGKTSPRAAAVHAGRRGLLAGIVPVAIERLGVPVDVYVGPCICPACYEVSAQMQEDSAAILPGVGASSRWGTPALDMRAGLRAQLAGNPLVGQIYDNEPCTYEDPTYYSYRRATHVAQRSGEGAQPRTGRFAGIVTLEERG